MQHLRKIKKIGSGKKEVEKTQEALKQTSICCGSSFKIERKAQNVSYARGYIAGYSVGQMCTSGGV